MVTAVSIIEIVIMLGVLWNAFLQTYWFFWSKKIHDNGEYGRKHFTDSEEIDAHDSLEQHAKQLRDQRTWENFQEMAPMAPDQVKRPVPSEVSPPQRKYNPDEIEGKLDLFFKKEK